MDEAALVVMRFAFPCADISLQLGHITAKEYERIEQALRAGRPLPREEIERYWPALFRRLKEVAAREGLDYWDLGNIRLHYLKHHDAYIDAGDGLLGEMMPVEKDLCRCRLGRVEAVDGEVLTVKLPEGVATVSARYLPGVSRGDIVAVHRRFATDRLAEGTAAAYGFLRS